MCLCAERPSRLKPNTAISTRAVFSPHHPHLVGARRPFRGDREPRSLPARSGRTDRRRGRGLSTERGKPLAALEELGAHLRYGESTARLPTDLPNLLEQSNMWNLRTIYGDLDMLVAPRGGGYDHLLQNAEWVNVSGYPVLVASLDDIIRSKELANRPKDHIALPELRRFRDERERD